MIWYEDEVKHLENEYSKIAGEPETLFYGSSTIRLWTSLKSDFRNYKPVNLGFGGSTLAACVWFFDRIMMPYHPKRLIVYAGDNDLGDGRHPEEVFIFFQQLIVRVAHRFGNIPCYFISLKPSISRWDIVDKFEFANTLIEKELQSYPNWHYIDIFKAMLDTSGQPRREYFSDDGLHLSKAGYLLWAAIVNKQLIADN